MSNVQCTNGTILPTLPMSRYDIQNPILHLQSLPFSYLQSLHSQSSLSSYSDSSHTKPSQQSTLEQDIMLLMKSYSQEHREKCDISDRQLFQPYWLWTVVCRLLLHVDNVVLR